jgi:hypothetical protein
MVSNERIMERARISRSILELRINEGVQWNLKARGCSLRHWNIPTSAGNNRQGIARESLLKRDAFLRSERLLLVTPNKTTNSVVLSPQANYTD